jgi:MFS family permease
VPLATLRRSSGLYSGYVLQVFMIKAVHSIGTLLLEIPSGVFSDCFGRKPALLISNVASGLYWFSMGSAWSERPVEMLAATQVRFDLKPPIELNCMY